MQSISNSRKIYTPSRGFSLNLKDPVTVNLIRPSTMLEAHITCGNEISKLPRVIEKRDKRIKFSSDFFDMFRKQYEKVFGYNLVIKENVLKNIYLRLIILKLNLISDFDYLRTSVNLIKFIIANSII